MVPKREEWIGDPKRATSKRRYRQMHTTPVGVEIHELREDVRMERDHEPYRTPSRRGGAHPSATRLEVRYIDHKVTKKEAISMATRPLNNTQKRRTIRRKR
jgi:hypothetical protein